MQAIRDRLDEKYRTDEIQQVALLRSQEQTWRARGEELIRSSLESLLAGEQRAAWQALHITGDADKAAALALPWGFNQLGLYCAAIQWDEALRTTADELAARIHWSCEAEEAEHERARRANTLQTASLVDFEDLDRQLAQTSALDNRPTPVGVIYSITMPDGEVYVGKTTRSVETRWREHRGEAEAGDGKPKSRALRYWCAQGRERDIRWNLEETVLGWSEDDLANAEKRWMRMGTLNVMDATRVATLYPDT